MMIPASILRDITTNKDVLYGFVCGIVIAFFPIGALLRNLNKIKHIEEGVNKNSKDINNIGKSIHDEISAINQALARHDEAISFIKDKFHS